jgi:protein ImuA
MPLARAISLRAPELGALRAKLAAYEPAWRAGRTLRFGDGRVDGCFLAGGLPLGCWHEMVGDGTEAEAAVVTAGFAGRLAARFSEAGQVVWVLRRDDLYAPALAELGLTPDRLIVVRAASEAEALAAIEDAVRTRGVACAVGEIETVDLTAGRRLQLACERGGATALIVRRRLYGQPSRARPRVEPAVAATRWRIGSAPSEPLAGEPGLGAPRFTARLERSRGGRSGGWIMEANWETQNGAVPFRVVAELADHALSTGQSEGDLRRAAG